jgi:hypothetical protein
VVVPPILLKEMKELRDTLPGLKEKYETLVFELPSPPTTTSNL